MSVEVTATSSAHSFTTTGEKVSPRGSARVPTYPQALILWSIGFAEKVVGTGPVEPLVAEPVLARDQNSTFFHAIRHIFDLKLQPRGHCIPPSVTQRTRTHLDTHTRARARTCGTTFDLEL